MSRSPTRHFIAQAAEVAKLLDEGKSNREIAERMGVSAPRVAQIRHQLPWVREYLGNPAPNHRLRSHRAQLWALRRETLALAAVLRRDLRELDEELEAAQMDRQLGLRPN
jgi:hypothetical protein